MTQRTDDWFWLLILPLLFCVPRLQWMSPCLSWCGRLKGTWVTSAKGSVCAVECRWWSPGPPTLARAACSTCCVRANMILSPATPVVLLSHDPPTLDIRLSDSWQFTVRINAISCHFMRNFSQMSNFTYVYTYCYQFLGSALFPCDVWQMPPLSLWPCAIVWAAWVINRVCSYLLQQVKQYETVRAAVFILPLEIQQQAPSITDHICFSSHRPSKCYSASACMNKFKTSRNHSHK